MAYTPMELATVFIQTGELSDALAALDEQLAAQPFDDSARRLRAATRLRLRDAVSLQAALADYAALTTPTPDDQVQRSIVHEQLGDVPAAIAAMDDVLVMQPSVERWLERQVTLLQKHGDFASALAIVDTQPHTWRWEQWRGDLQAGARQLATAIVAYTDALALLGAVATDLEPS
ncbi:MAG: hypothetical protein H7Y11_13330, partial [Armatimonadetes bacterium]|nr:hypothetical protein [Anaerolineae bacterium]